MDVARGRACRGDRPDSFASLTASAALHGVAVPAPPSSELDSAAHVKAVAHHKSVGSRDEIVVTLTIDAGYHVNANPASADYLVPTTVKVPGVETAKITYPPARTFKPKFSSDAISVYERQASIKIELPSVSVAEARRSPASIEVQACNSEVCLAPATIEVQLGKC